MLMGYGNISGVLLPADKADIKTNIEGIQAKMPFLINLTAEERKRLRTIGPHRLSYVTEVNLASNAHVSSLAASFKLDEFNKDKILLSDLAEVYSVLSPLHDAVVSTMMALGAEVMKHSDKAYGYLKVSAKTNTDAALNSAIQRIADLLKQTKNDDNP